jgi:hypothetical protein
VGERIYLEGVLSSGTSVQGGREGGVIGTGIAVACVNCHRRSGLGASEGTIRVPPITAKYLYSRTGVQGGRPTLSAASASEASRAAYDDRSLADAIRSGTGRGGGKLNYLMPRYTLDPSSMKSLIAYLETLPVLSSPGVSDTTIDIATIVTPDADPVARDGMLAVLEQFVTDKNAFIRGGFKPLHTQGQIDYRVTRRWQLHVWTLLGAADTWEEQLRRRLRSEPVFAVLSGIGGQTWAPIHRFCATERLPCLFPNVEIPVDDEREFYSIYLSKGALLESELIAAQLAATKVPGRLLQVYARGDIGEAAAGKLQSLTAGSIQSARRPVPQGDAHALAQAIGEAGPDDVLVLWLRPADLVALAATAPATSGVYISGELAGLEHAPLPPAWRRVVQMTYPADLPAARAIRMNYPLRWFQIRHVAVVAEKVQADTYLACGILSEALNDMLDNFMRDFLIERIESMVSHRQLTGYYPRLGLGPGQRFASKGGYMVHFDDPSGLNVTPASDWVVP